MVIKDAEQTSMKQQDNNVPPRKHLKVEITEELKSNNYPKIILAY
jgi:hypothetical protein